MLLDWIRATCFLPGQVENWIFVFNVDKLGLGDVDREAMKRVLGFLALVYNTLPDQQPQE